MKLRFFTILFFCIGIITFVFASEPNFLSKTIHIGVVVSDMDKAMHFYKDVLGMVQVDKTFFDIDKKFGKSSGLTGGMPFHVEILKLGSGDDATQWKLMTFGKKSKKQKNAFIQDHTGMQYITIFVHELKPILKRIKEAGIKLLGDTPVKLGADNHFVLIQDPDGTFVELIGPMGE